MIRKILKIFVYLFIIVLLLVIIAIGCTQTGIFKNLLRDKIVETANNALNGTLHIGEINGNLFTNFQIERIALTSETDTIAAISRLAVAFLPTRLLNKEVILRFAELNAPYFLLKQLPDSSWNVSELVKQEESLPEEKTSSSGPFAWHIILEDMKIIDGSMDIAPLGTSQTIPEKIRHLNCILSLSYDKEGLSTTMRDFSLRALQPDLTVAEVSFLLLLENNGMSVQDLKLITDNSQLFGELILNFSENPEYMIKLSPSEVSLDEISNFVPDLGMQGIASINGLVNYAGDDLKTDIQLQHRNQHIKLVGFLKNLHSLPDYDIQAKISRFDPAVWLKGQTLNSRLTGQLQLKGTGFKPDSSKGSLKIFLQKSRIYGQPVDSLTITSTYDFGDIVGKITLVSESGHINLHANINDIGRNPEFNIRSTIRDFDLSAAILKQSEPSNIDMTISVAGNGASFSEFTGHANIFVSQSGLYNTTIDTMFSAINLDHKVFEIDTLYIRNPIGDVQSRGRIAIGSTMNVNYLAQIYELNRLEPIIKQKGLTGHAWLRGHLSGVPDSLKITGNARMISLKYNDIGVDTIQARYHASIADNFTAGKINARLKRITTNQINLDSLTLESNFRPDSIHALVDFFQSENISGYIESHIGMGEVTRIKIPTVELNVLDYQWKNSNPDLTVLIQPDEFHIENLNFVSEDQSIAINGMFTTSGRESLSVDITGLNFGFLSEFENIPQRIDGILDMNAQLTGIANAPLINGDLKISDGFINEYNYDNFTMSFNYTENLLDWQMSFIPLEGAQLNADGKLPINLAFTENTGRIDSSRNVFAHIKGDSIDFAVIKAASNLFRDVTGHLAIDLIVDNPINNLYPAGSLALSDGTFKIPKYGIRYNDINVTLSVDSSRFTIDRFITKSNDGLLSVSGDVQIDHTKADQFLKSIDVNIAADKFLIMSNDNYEMVIEGDVIITGTKESPEFDGLIRVLRSRFYIPALMEGGNGKVREIEPLLVQASGDTFSTIRSVKTTLDTTSTLTLIDNLKGSARIEMPRNTWIRSPDMNVELSGELVLVKQGKQFELFGSINVRRGTYDIYGKRFKIEKGVFNFQGGVDFNPQIELIAEHVFRTAEREKQTLLLKVTGTALSPKLNFTLDDIEISEGDALSYIIFGKNLEELTHGQKTDLDEKSGFDAQATANNLVVGFIAGQLSRTLGKTLDLDMIELKSEENWQYATFIVGKYLTNDLFLSYKRQFGENQTNEIVPNELTLEYEVTPKLFLQLIQGSEKTSGFDVIIKFER